MNQSLRLNVLSIHIKRSLKKHDFIKGALTIAVFKQGAEHGVVTGSRWLIKRYYLLGHLIDCVSEVLPQMLLYTQLKVFTRTSFFKVNINYHVQFTIDFSHRRIFFSRSFHV